jgi:uncharacterized protein (TIGR01244 family)
MEIIRKINDELSIAGQVSYEQLQDIAQEGFKAVLCLRSKTNLLVGEQQYVEALGLWYLNPPIESQTISAESVGWVLKQMDILPKPVLIYCANAKLAAAMALMHIAMHQGMTLQQAFQRAEQLGLFSTTSYEMLKC